MTVNKEYKRKQTITASQGQQLATSVVVKTRALGFQVGNGRQPVAPHPSPAVGAAVSLIRGWGVLKHTTHTMRMDCKLAGTSYCCSTWAPGTHHKSPLPPPLF